MINKYRVRFVESQSWKSAKMMSFLLTDGYNSLSGSKVYNIVDFGLQSIRVSTKI